MTQIPVADREDEVMLFIPLSRFKARVFIPLVAASLAAIIGCMENNPKLSIEDARVEHSRAVAGELNIYLKIKNEGAADTLRSVRAGMQGATARINGLAEDRLTRTDLIGIPADRTVELRAGDSHIAVGNIPKEAGAGDQFTLTLVFEKSGEKPLQLIIPRVPGRTGGVPDGKGMTVRD